MRVLAVAMVLLLIGGMMPSCSEEHKEVIDGDVDYEVTPTMTTTRVETLISDSGIIRYRITSPVWYMFEEAQKPRWTFPEGLTLERYDNYFKKDGTITCDSATYLKQQGLWRLDGNVRVTNPVGEKFLTNQLFWNEKSHRVYSDSFIHIERADRVLEGFGFNSNDRMTEYVIRNVSGIFPVESFRAGDATPDDNPPGDDLEDSN